jgi:catechol 2,3-dioxygenase-like lactoylglutathione lyase family enzyme
MITGVNKVLIGVRDQDRANAFWTKTMSFELVQDVPHEGERCLSDPKRTKAANAGGRTVEPAPPVVGAQLGPVGRRRDAGSGLASTRGGEVTWSLLRRRMSRTMRTLQRNG